MAPWSAKTLKPRGWVHPDRRRPNSAARGYGYKWRKIRDAYIAKHPFCAASGCNDKAVAVDHILAD